MLDRLIVGSASVPGGAQAELHTDGTREQSVAFAEDFYCRLIRAMYQKLRTPIEQIQFAWVQFRRELILPNRFDRIFQPTLDLAQQVMKVGTIVRIFTLRRQQRSNMAARA